MRTAHDWGRASARPHRSAPVSRTSYYARAIVCAAAATLVACNSPSSSDDTAATDPSGPVVSGNVSTRLEESTRSVVDGVAYPFVTVKPAATATLSVGQQVTFYASLSEPNGNVWNSCCSTWTSSNPDIASVTVTGSGSSAGEHATVVAHKAGRVTVTATTQSNTSGTLTVTVGSAPPSTSSGSGSTSGETGSGGSPTAKPPSTTEPSGSAHEPSGMATQVNTGTIKSTAPFAVFSPWTATDYGESSQNLTTVPGATGMRITYRPNLWGGYSPVRFGVSLPSAGTGWYYQRMNVRFSPNWTMSGNIGVKLCEPRTQQLDGATGENEVIGAQDFETNSTHAWLYTLLQGPNGQSRDLFEQPHYTPAAELAGGAWHTIEVLFTPESSPGTGNGTYTAWVDGTQIAHYTNVQFLARGNRVGFPYLMFDPTYGGGSNRPATTMYWDFDQLYVSTK